jgi:thioredoxin-like negative regulator of GroEL
VVRPLQDDRAHPGRGGEGVFGPPESGKLNIDENQGTPPKYGIRGIPTLMLFKNGAVEATKVGALSKSQLTAFIDSHI